MKLTVSQRVGDIDIIVLTDGARTFDASVFPGTDSARIDALLAPQGESEIRTNFNAALIRSGDINLLVDAGPRDLMGPSAGRLPDALAETGTAPDQIDRIFATHLHPDHVAGMLTRDGTAAFKNAELIVTDRERLFWNDTSHFAQEDETFKSWQKLAQAVLNAYSDRLTVIPDEATLAPGVTAFHLPGHTPGHSGVRIASGTAQLLHVGDIVHAPALQLPAPDIAVAFDIDAEEARVTRRRLLDQLAIDCIPFTGGHFLHPALAQVDRSGDGYQLMSL